MTVKAKEWVFGRSHPYPWEEWFGKAVSKPLKLTRGKHYPGQDAYFGDSCRKQARTRKLKISVSLGDGHVTIQILGKKGGKK